MARGFLSGVIWGGVVCLGISGVASLLSPLPTPPEVSDAAPGATQAPQRIEDAANGESAVLNDLAPATETSVQRAPAPEPDTLQAVRDTVTASASLPETGDAEGLADPAESADSAAVAPQSEAPVLPNPQAVAPMEPQPADELSISTEPAQPPAPVVQEAETAFEPPADEEPVLAEPEIATAEPQPEPETEESVAQAELPAPEVKETLEQVETAPVVEEVLEQAEATLPDADDVTAQAEAALDMPFTEEATEESAPAEREVVAEIEAPAELEVASELEMPAEPDAPAEQEVLAEAEPEETKPATENTEEVVDKAEAPAEAEQFSAIPEADLPEPTDAETDAPEIAAVAPPPLVQATDDTEAEETTDETTEAEETQRVARPGIGKPAAITSERDTGVAVNRLPTAITDADESEAAGPVAPEDAPPIDRFAAEFENAEDKPVMSIILIDSGSDLSGQQIGIAALRSFPYPLSFAVDVRLPDATERMDTYRSEGFEVLAMIGLPEGATPSDAEVAFADTIRRMPEVVGLLENAEKGVQPSRATSDQVIAILAQSGHGLVTQNAGLNTMIKLAVKQGVPAAPIFRDFDSKDQSPSVIRRFLDQAAFRAGQEGAVIMLGRMRPDTVSALLLWGLQDRAGQVALAPVSAVLKSQVSE